MVVGDFFDTRNKDNYSPTSMDDVLSAKTPEFDQAQKNWRNIQQQDRGFASDSSEFAESPKVSSKLFF